MRKSSSKKNVLTSTLRMGRAGRLTIRADFNNLKKKRKGKGIALAEEILSNVSEDFAKKVIVPFYKRLILRTPVWRGTARMNWKFAVGNKVAFGGIAANKSLIDPELRPAASKMGVPESATEYATPNENIYPSGYKMIRGRRLDIVKTQRDFGRDTSSVKKMVKEAERLIDEHFGKVKNRRTGSNNIRKIRIFNPLPYIRFLEGTGELGRTYKRGSSIWSDKIGKPPFVAANNESGQYPIGKYKAGYIGKSLSNLKGQFTKRYGGDIKKISAKKSS